MSLEVHTCSSNNTSNSSITKRMDVNGHLANRIRVKANTMCNDTNCSNCTKNKNKKDMSKAGVSVDVADTGESEGHVNAATPVAMTKKNANSNTRQESTSPSPAWVKTRAM
jgi:hypothetical protein